MNIWKAAGIYVALEITVSRLPSIDPFQDILPLANTCDSASDLCTIGGLTDKLGESFVNDINGEESSELEQGDNEDNAGFKRNVFEFIRDDE